MTLVELCAGTAAVSLWALGRGRPLTGFMGSKSRWAGGLVDALGCDRPARVVLVDAGPWGDVWTVLRDRAARAEVAVTFDRLEASGARPNELWSWFATVPPPADPVARVAQYLWLQARSAGTIPMWWSPERGRWESPSGSRTESAHARGGVAAAGRVQTNRPRSARFGPCGAGPAYAASGARGLRGGAAVGKPDHPGARGIQYPATIAARVRALDRLPWDRVEVVHGDLRDVAPIAGATVLFDPPYLGAPRYAALCPRADVLAVAECWRSAGCRVAVCEAVPLVADLGPGWHASRLPAVRRDVTEPREWATASWPIVLDRQVGLLEVS